MLSTQGVKILNFRTLRGKCNLLIWIRLLLGFFLLSSFLIVISQFLQHLIFTPENWSREVTQIDFRQGLPYNATACWAVPLLLISVYPQTKEEEKKSSLSTSSQQKERWQIYVWCWKSEVATCTWMQKWILSGKSLTKLTDRTFTSEDVSMSAAEAAERESYIISSCSYAKRSASECQVRAAFYSWIKTLGKKKSHTFITKSYMFF